MQLTGIHHLTAISADAPGNKRFYTGTMGMRMVKKTVNQDDTSAYHLFYGDAGEAFPWEKSPVPPALQIRGLGPITLSVPNLKPTDAVLTTLMGMRAVRTYPHLENARDTVHVYEMGEGGAGAELHVAVQPD